MAHEESPKAPRPIAELGRGDPQLARYIARREPCVVRGAAEGWAARQRWTPAYLRAACGELVAPVAALRAKQLATDARRGLLLEPTAMGRFLEALERGAPVGYLMAPLAALPPSLQADTEEPAPCRGAPWRSSKLWISPEGAVSPLHFDVADNLHVQVFGAKRFLLFAPGDRRALYPQPLRSSVPNFARVDPTRPDPARFPRFAAATPHLCRLAPGDMVYVPSRYWHHVTTESASISVNFWWARGALAAAARAADWLKRARAISR